MEIYRKAKHLLEKGELDSSFKYFTDFISTQRVHDQPECRAELTDAYNSRGHIRYLWVEFDDAISDYSEAIKLDPNFAVAYYNRGQIHYRLGISSQCSCSIIMYRGGGGGGGVRRMI